MLLPYMEVRDLKESVTVNDPSSLSLSTNQFAASEVNCGQFLNHPQNPVSFVNKYCWVKSAFMVLMYSKYRQSGM